jgi:hypothetical protein
MILEEIIALKSGDRIRMADGTEYIFRSQIAMKPTCIWVEMPPMRGMFLREIVEFLTPDATVVRKG